MEAIETRYRSHTAGQLRKSDVGKEVKLAGWVHSYRNHGHLVFIDLRDRDGITQLVFRPENANQFLVEGAAKLRAEWVISVKGIIAARDPSLINSKLDTGEIEVAVTD